MNPMSLLNIGSVSFGKACPVEQNSAEWDYQNIIGDERVKLLRMAMNGEELPDGLFLIGQSGGSGFRCITKEEVDWTDLTWRDNP